MEKELERPRTIQEAIESYLQAYAVASWTLLFLLGGGAFLLLFLCLLLYTSYWFLALLYFVWMYVDRETPFMGGRRFNVFRRGRFWRYYRDYFSCQLVKTVDLDTDKNYLFIFHPHGLFSYHAVANFGNDNPTLTKLFPHHQFYAGTLNLNFYFPIIRDLLMALGVVSVSKESILTLLGCKNKGICFSIVVGGAAEALLSTPKEYRLVLKKRMGFVKIALKTGCPLVPVFGFGEVDLFDTSLSRPGSKFYRFQRLMLKLTGVAFCIPQGQGFFGLMPHRKQLTTIVGEPIDMPKIQNPTEEQVKHYHDLYIEKLTNLFYDNRDKYAGKTKNINLIIE